MDDRFTIANMAIEAGGKNGIFPVDDLTRAYMKEHSKRPFVEYEADPDAEYDEEYTIDLSTLKSTVSFPHLPDNTRTIDEVGLKAQRSTRYSSVPAQTDVWKIFVQLQKS